MNDTDALLTGLADNSYRLHKLIEHISPMYAGEGFHFSHEEKEKFLAFVREQINQNADIRKALDNA